MIREKKCAGCGKLFALSHKRGKERKYCKPECGQPKRMMEYWARRYEQQIERKDRQ